MGCLSYFETKLQWANAVLHDYLFKVDARMRAEDFSRKGKLGFAETCFIILRASKRSLQAAIYTFLNESKSDLDHYSKQAFSQRRQFIKPEAFLALFRGITEDYYTDPAMRPKVFRGWNVFAIDGTAYNLPNTPELKERYGVQLSSGEAQVQAKGSCLYDILNNLLIDVKMLPIKTSEREIAREHLNYLHEIKPENNLVLLDRGYPSSELIQDFEQKGVSYLMRYDKASFFSELRTLTGADQILELEKTPRKTKETIPIKLRVIQFSLDSGAMETLITNVLDSDFTVDDFKYLYHLRWGIEEKYDEIKNKLTIEAFSGQTPVAVLQDFYATMFLSNLTAFAEMDCEEALALANDTLNRKHEYQINRTMAVASVKDALIQLAMETNPIKRERLLRRLRKRLLANLVPIRPGRSAPRQRKHHALKFHPNRTIT